MDMDIRLIIFIITQSVALIAIMIKNHINVSLKLKELDMRLRVVERQDDTIVKKLDQIADQLFDLKLELQNKKDKD